MKGGAAKTTNQISEVESPQDCQFNDKSFEEEKIDVAAHSSDMNRIFHGDHNSMDVRLDKKPSDQPTPKK
jgi:hypothetical protein